MEISVTSKATEQLLANGLGDGNFLRLGLQQGGCAGMSYSVFIDENRSANDHVIHEDGGLKIVADQEFLLLLDGLNIDFSDDLIQPGFILKNPNSQKSCGCGSSFKAREEDPITPSGGTCG